MYLQKKVIKYVQYSIAPIYTRNGNINWFSLIY